jgi:cytochrome c oxidase subunit II
METCLKGSERKLFRFAALGLLLVVALVMTGCEGRAPQDFLNHPVGEPAKDADRLWDIVFAIAVVIFVLVEAVLVFAVVKFRRRPGREAAQFHGNTRLEIVLTLIPALLLAGLAVPMVSTLFAAAEEQPGALQIRVVGKQFWWEYEYMDSGVITANELHIPTGTPIRLVIEGDPNDVIHSYWAPRLFGKQDVVPGRTNFINMEAPTPGTYWGQCTEYCGLSHANMRLRVIAQDPDEFEDWLALQEEPAAEPTSGAAAEGQKLFLENACAGCHAIEGTDAAARVGPDLTHLAGRSTFAGAMFETNEQNLVKWVTDAPGVKPGVKMPSFRGQLTSEEVESIVAYLLTLE